MKLINYTIQPDNQILNFLFFLLSFLFFLWTDKKVTSRPDDDDLEELANIPMHRTLQRSQASRQKNGLNGSELCHEDLFDSGFESKSVNFKPALSQFNLPSHKAVVIPFSSGEDEETEDNNGDDCLIVDEILQLEVVKKILRETKLNKSSKDIRSKLLSSKIKL